MKARVALVAALALAIPATAGRATAPAGDREPPRFRVLVYTEPDSFHASVGSVPAAVAAIQEMGERRSFGVAARTNPVVFRREVLRRYDAVVMVSPDGDVLDPRSGARVRALHPRRGRVRRRPRRLPRRARLALLRRAGRGPLHVPSAHPGGDRAHRRRRAPGDARPAATVDAGGRVVRVRPQPASVGARARDGRRGHLRGRDDGRRPSDQLVPGVPRGPFLLHGDGPLARVVLGAGAATPPARRDPLGRRRPPRRLHRGRGPAGRTGARRGWRGTRPSS